MKKVLYQSLYRVLLFLSNHLNSKLIIKYKVLLGTSLIVLMSSAYQAPKKSNAVVHDKPLVIDDTVKVQDVELDDFIDVLCYNVVMPDELVSDENHIYYFVDEPPEFPGGHYALDEYIKKSIQYPETAKKDSIRGVIEATFVVNKDGSVSDAETWYGDDAEYGRGTWYGLDSLLDKEVYRIINSMPPQQWKPGKLKDTVVRVRQRVSVRFYVPHKFPEYKDFKRD